eukprot:11207965-Lingulodinium_polyedra.AAC.1
MQARVVALILAFVIAPPFHPTLAVVCRLLPSVVAVCRACLPRVVSDAVAALLFACVRFLVVRFWVACASPKRPCDL